jgi:hypothetical protein
VGDATGQQLTESSMALTEERAKASHISNWRELMLTFGIWCFGPCAYHLVLMMTLQVSS